MSTEISLEKLEEIITQIEIEIGSLKEELKLTKNQLQKKCPHEHVKATAATTWHEWTDYGTTPGNVNCKRCNAHLGENLGAKYET